MEMHLTRLSFISSLLFCAQDETVLTHCVKMQSVDAVASLIKAGADPNQPSKKGVTPISAAAHKGNVLIMQMLIDSGASVNSINSSGSTALIQVKFDFFVSMK